MVNKKLVAVGVGAGAVVAGVLIGRQLLHKSGKPPPPAAPPAIDLTFAKTVADAIATQKALNRTLPGDEGKTHRLRYFFLHRRAIALGLADPALRVAPGISQLQQRIALQFDKVESFLAPLVGTLQARGPYFGGADDPAHPKPNRHLDLGLYVHVRDMDPPVTTEAAAVAATSPNAQQAQTLRELDVRKMRVATIVWRAAAIDADLWSGTGDAATLREDEFHKLLDRRLRAVERLHYEVSAGATQERHFGGRLINESSGHSGPWVDGFLLHAFERPSIARTARSDDGTWAPEEFILGQGSLIHKLSEFDATAGNFTLVFDGEATPPIPFDATKEKVRAALQTLPGLDTAQIDCSDGPLPAETIRIHITGQLKPDARLTIGSNTLTGPGPDAPTLLIGVPDLVFDIETQAVPRYNLGGSNTFGQPFTPHWYLNHTSDEFDWNEWPGTRLFDKRFWRLTPDSSAVKGYGWNLLPPAAAQTVFIKGSPKTGGTFKLTFNGQATETLAPSATAATVKKALAALPGGGPKVIVGGGPLPDAITLYFDASVPTDHTLGFSDNQLTPTTAGDPQPEPQVGVRGFITGDPPAKVIDDLFNRMTPSRPGPDDSHGNPTTIPGDNRNDWWNRSWLHADGVMAALHIEALRFALMRHAVAGPGLRLDDEFNALPWKYTLSLDDCFGLRDVAHPANSVMAPGKNDYFENGITALDDLQVGDQVLFADSPALTVLGRTAWDYPTLLVTDVDTSAVDTPTIDLGRLKVQGFITDELTLPDYQLLQVGITDEVLKRVQAYIPAEIARRKADAAANSQPGSPPFAPPDKLEWDIGILNPFERASGDDTVLRRWSPYGDTFDEPGPWWLWVNTHSTLWRKVFAIQETPLVDGDTDENGVIDGDEVEPPPRELDAAQVLMRMPGALIWTKSTDAEEDADTGTNPHANTRIRFANFQSPWRRNGASPILRVRADFNPPPFKDTRDPGAEHEDVIMIPLFQPYGDWDSYFETKIQSPGDSAWPPELRPVTADTRWFTGLEPDRTVLPADPTRVRVIRPRAKPSP